jgi:hypothetical protein
VKAKKKPAEKNNKGLSKIQSTVTRLRDEYEAKYPFAIDYGDVQTPEGMPTFEEFVNSKSAGRTYNEADPLWQYQKTSQMGPLAYQRWRGAKTSVDGKNYRVPYMTPLEVQKVSSKTTGTKLGSEVTADGKLTLGEYGLGGVGLDGYKDGHRKQMENRNFIDKVKGLPGTILPPLNMLSGGASASGGKNLTTAAFLASLAKTGKIAYDNNEFSDIAPLAGGLAASSGLFLTTPSKAVVPTSGFMINPFGKAVRGLKKDARKDERKLDKKLLRGTRFYEQEAEKEKANLEREASLYEKKYGVRPTLPNQTMSYKPAAYTSGEGRRTENRNPVFLKNGGLLFMSAKKNRSKK